MNDFVTGRIVHLLPSAAIMSLDGAEENDRTRSVYVHYNAVARSNISPQKIQLDVRLRCRTKPGRKANGEETGKKKSEA
jgi:hypothetical protein